MTAFVEKKSRWIVVLRHYLATVIARMLTLALLRQTYYLGLVRSLYR